MSLKDSTVLTSLEGLPSSQTLKTLHISKSKLTDVSQITNAPNLDMFQLIMGGVTDLTPFGSLTKLTNMDLYGCDVKDLTPLSKIPTLKKLNLYGTDNTDYTTLANLKQVQEVELGATKLPSLAFIKDMPALKSLSTFNNEELADLSPISGTGIEYLKIWMLKYPVDLNQIKDATKMKKIEITGCNTGVPVSNFAALSNMKELAEIKISGLKDRCNTEVDGNFAKGLTKVKTLYLDSIHNLTNTEAFGDMVNLEKAWLLELNGTFDVSFFGRMPSLKEVHIKKTAVTGLESLAKCSNLQTLDIAEVTDKKVIDAVKALPKLQSLTVSKSDNIYGMKNGTFYLAAGGTIPANRAYLQLNASAGAPSRLDMVIGEATALQRVQDETNAEVWYTISGVRVERPTKAGIYIKNGRKVLVK